MKRKIELLYIDAGGGHRAAANALAEAIRSQDRPWDVRLVCIQDLFGSFDPVRRLTGIPFHDVYNIMLRRGWTLGAARLIPVMHAIIRSLHGAQVEALERHWAPSQPDMVVSLMPHFNRAFKRALERACPAAPLVTVLTDIADYPPHFWIERQDQYVICGSDKAVEQALALGLSPLRIFRTSGMILHPRFYDPVRVDRRAERIRLGLAPDRLTGIALFGGEGSMDLVRVARTLEASGLPTQLILLCGRHAEAARQIRNLGGRMPMVVEGFTRQVPYYMALADYFIGKPGPGCISEALAMSLPVIVEKNAWTLAHERYNADWIVECGAGIALDSFTQLPRAVGELLRPERYRAYKEATERIRNFAVFEIPEMLEQILGETRFAEIPACPDFSAEPAAITPVA